MPYDSAFPDLHHADLMVAKEEVLAYGGKEKQ